MILLSGPLKYDPQKTPGIDVYDGGDHVHIWVWNLGKTNIFGDWDFEDWKKYLGSKIDDKLTYLGSEISEG